MKGFRLAPDLNLAARPSQNGRPVRRVALFLVALAAILGGLDFIFFSSYLDAARATQSELESVRRQSVAEIESARRLEEELRKTNVELLNERVGYLNRRIAERTFPWGRLFDELAEVLPQGVRLTGLSRLSIADRGDPRQGRRKSEPEAAPGFALRLQGFAETTDDLLRLVDALFRAPSFKDVDLTSESQEAEGVRFEIGVNYSTAPAPTTTVPTAPKVAP